LLKDWSVGEPRVSHLSFSPNTAVNNVKLVDNHNNVVECLLSTAKNICSYEVGGEKIQDTIDVEETPDNDEVSDTVKDGLKLNLRLPSTSLNSKINSAFLQNGEEGRYKKLFSNNNENIERSQITEFDILKNYLIAGNNNGMLSIWDLETSLLLNSKQLFGIITGVKCLSRKSSQSSEEDDLIVTSHAGKGFDIGCISVRRMVSPSELSVIWSAYQDVMPVFCVDVTDKFILSLEWLGTFDMVHVGSATLYTWNSIDETGKYKYFRRDFSESELFTVRWSSAGIFKDDFAALCSCDDAGGTIERHQIFIYNLTNLTVLQSFTGHLSGIFQVISCGDILITRDKDGVIFLWDSNLAIKDDYKDTEPENAALIRKFDLPHRDKFLGVDVDLRRLAICKIGGVQVLDFWNAAES